MPLTSCVICPKIHAEKVNLHGFMNYFRKIRRLTNLLYFRNFIVALEMLILMFLLNIFKQSCSFLVKWLIQCWNFRKEWCTTLASPWPSSAFRLMCRTMLNGTSKTARQASGKGALSFLWNTTGSRACEKSFQNQLVRKLFECSNFKCCLFGIDLVWLVWFVFIQ